MQNEVIPLPEPIKKFLDFVMFIIACIGFHQTTGYLKVIFFILSLWTSALLAHTIYEIVESILNDKER